MSETTPIAQQVFDAKWVANGFPKSGTHLLVQMLRPLAPFQPGTQDGNFASPWAGTYTDNSFTTRRWPLEYTTFRLGRVGNGRLLKAHLGYDPELARFIYLTGIVHVFIYRDLRDVAVSQAHHILDAENTDRLAHPAPQLYDRENFDTLLLQVIRGHGPFPALVERWEEYAGWLEDDWVLPVQYEQVLAHPKEHALSIFGTAMARMGERFGVKVALEPHGADVVTDVMVQAASQTHNSPTFRRGQPGEWREVFTAAHVAAFCETGGDYWLQELGYEPDTTWATTGPFF